MRKLLIGFVVVSAFILTLLWIEGRKADTSVINWMAEGNLAYEQGDYPSALEAYRTGMMESPESVELKFNYEWVEQLIPEQQQEEQQQEQQQENGDEQDSQEGQNQEGNQEGGQDEVPKEGNEPSEQGGGSQDEPENTLDDSASQGSAEDESENSSITEEEGADPQNEEVQQILRILEDQETESLKNNQSLQEGKAGEGNDW